MQTRGAKVIVTGGAGFLGSLLVRTLLKRREVATAVGPAELSKIVVLDVAQPPPDIAVDERVEVVTGDLASGDFLGTVFAEGTVGVFHLASMVSAECELSPGRAWDVNVGGLHAILEAARRCGERPRVVFASSIAVYGGDYVKETVTDDTRVTPETTYGTTKVVGELLVADYSRKGYIDGRSARLPTVIVRPGRPNAAASSWVSGIFREPLAGVECCVPVDVSTQVPLSGYQTVVQNLLRLYEVDPARLPAGRALNFPALAPTVDQMLACLERIGGRQAVGRVSFAPSEAVVNIFQTWARSTTFRLAEELQLQRDASLDDVVAQYVRDFMERDA